MAQEHNFTGDVLGDDRDSRSYAFGLFLSRVFHPIFLNILMFLTVGYFAMPTHMQGFLWAMTCIAAMVLPPTIFFAIRLRQGVYSDEDISVREQRTELYFFGLVSVTAGAIVLVLLGLPKPFLALIVSALTMGVLGMVINSFWKISVHAGSVASAAAVATVYSRGLGLALWLCVLAVGWARIKTGNHSPLQVLAGAVLAAVVVFSAFRWIA